MIFILKRVLAIAIPTISVFSSNAQLNAINYQLEGQAIATSSDRAPFWFKARQGGSVPLDGLSGSLIANIHKDYDTTRNRLIDWGFGFEGRANGGQKGSDFILVQGNAKVKLAMFEIRAGRWRQQVGFVDTLLSSGAFSISGNALGIPQVQLSIPEFYPIPFTNGWFSIKGSLSHGWLGRQPIQSSLAHVPEVQTLFHHKSLYGRIGRENSRIILYGGFNHQTFWGNENKIFGPTFALTTWQSYQSVLYGRNWAGSKVGNHLGSIDLSLGFNIKNSKILLYRQFFYEIGALAHWGNIIDGLNGISVKNRKTDSGKGFRWEKAILEVLYSKNQAGKLSSPPTPSGYENYYNHYLYANGWLYEGKGLGNPLFTPKHEAREGQKQIESNYFINNRIFALHGALTAYLYNWFLTGRLTYSKNYGLYPTGKEPYRTPYFQINYPSPDNYFNPVDQFSAFLSAERKLKQVNKSKIAPYWGAQIAFDAGKLLDSSIGMAVKYGIRFF